MTAGSFYGKYRGVVTGNVDPLQLGRIRVRVPDVTGDVADGWALACVPCGAGGLAVPDIGAQVWVEFERGEPDHPIWTGCAWPASVAGHVILIDDTPGQGGITLRAATGASISITDAGVVIDNGAGAVITLIGPQVSINNGALDVT